MPVLTIYVAVGCTKYVFFRLISVKSEWNSDRTFMQYKKLATDIEASFHHLFFFLKCTNTNTIMQMI